MPLSRKPRFICRFSVSSEGRGTSSLLWVLVIDNRVENTNEIGKLSEL
jgi:hypothetical protein